MPNNRYIGLMKLKYALPVEMIPVKSLIPHEEILESHACELKDEIAMDGHIHEPLIVDRATLVVLDGHHRRAVASRLGIEVVPCIMIDYFSSEIQIEAWRSGEAVTKERVISAGLSGNLMPPKTSKHSFVQRLAA